MPGRGRLSFALGTPAEVSQTNLRPIERPKVSRTVSRWYYLLQAPKLLAPGLYGAATRKLVAAG